MKTNLKNNQSKLNQKILMKKACKIILTRFKKRIKKLTFQIREAERREKAAVDYAKGLKNKYETAEKEV